MPEIKTDTLSIHCGAHGNITWCKGFRLSCFLAPRGNRLTTYFDIANVLDEEVQVQDDNTHKHATSSSGGRLVVVFQTTEYVMPLTIRSGNVEVQ